MPIKPFRFDGPAQQDSLGVFITLPAPVVEGWPLEISGNGLQLWDGFSAAASRVSLPDNALNWHISISYWGEAADGIPLGVSSGDFVTKDSMRTFASFLHLGLSTAFDIQCSEADAVLQAQQQSGALQRQIDALKASAVQRDVENSPEYQAIIARNNALLAALADLQAKLPTATPVAGQILEPVAGGTDTSGFYMPDFWAGVTESPIVVDPSSSTADVIQRLRTA